MHCISEINRGKEKFKLISDEITHSFFSSTPLNRAFSVHFCHGIISASRGETAL